MYILLFLKLEISTQKALIQRITKGKAFTPPCAGIRSKIVNVRVIPWIGYRDIIRRVKMRDGRMRWENGRMRGWEWEDERVVPSRLG